MRAAAWQLDERGGGGGNGAKAKRRRELCSFARTTGRDGEGRWLIESKGERGMEKRGNGAERRKGLRRKRM